MAFYATKNVSQAAALALRQLQDQLSVAYTDNAKLQQERSDLRAEMHTVAEGQTAELEQSQADSTKLAKQVTEMRTMLEEMRDALETTADENAQLSRDHESSSKASMSLEQELETSRLVTPCTGCHKTWIQMTALHQLYPDMKRTSAMRHACAIMICCGAACMTISQACKLVTLKMLHPQSFFANIPSAVACLKNRQQNVIAWFIVMQEGLGACTAVLKADECAHGICSPDDSECRGCLSSAVSCCSSC